jgi:hypothetical protein
MVSLLAVLEYSDSYPTVYRYFYVEWNRASVFPFCSQIHLCRGTGFQFCWDPFCGHFIYKFFIYMRDFLFVQISGDSLFCPWSFFYYSGSSLDRVLRGSFYIEVQFLSSWFLFFISGDQLHFFSGIHCCPGVSVYLWAPVPPWFHFFCSSARFPLRLCASFITEIPFSYHVVYFYPWEFLFSARF